MLWSPVGKRCSGNNWVIFPDESHWLQLQWPIPLMFHFSTNLLPPVMDCVIIQVSLRLPVVPLCDSWRHPSQLQHSLPSHGTGNGRSTSDFRTTPIFPSVPSLLTLEQAILATAENQHHLQCWETLNSIWTEFASQPTLNGTTGSGGEEWKDSIWEGKVFLQRNGRKLIETAQDPLLYQKADRDFGGNVNCLPQIKHPLLKNRFLC